jgi:hypothetical protein
MLYGRSTLKLFFILAFWLGCLLISKPIFAETLYVKAPNTKVFSESSLRSKIVAIAQKGTPVDVLEKENNFYKISFSKDKIGWVLKSKLNPEPPDLIDDGNLIRKLAERPNITTRETGSSSSIRARDVRSLDIDELNKDQEQIDPEDEGNLK